MNIKHETIRPVVSSKQAFFEFWKNPRTAVAAHNLVISSSLSLLLLGWAAVWVVGEGDGFSNKT